MCITCMWFKSLWLAKMEKICDITQLISVTDLSVSSGQKVYKLQWMDIFSSAVYQRKKWRYCHHSGVVFGVGGGVVVVLVVVVVVTNFNLGYNFINNEANLIKLHMLVNHHKGYTLIKDHNSARLFDKIMPLIRYATCKIGLCVDYRSVNSLC